ncbi:MAG: NapC/NirT family cytochrome c [Rhodospirillales bacterium]
MNLRLSFGWKTVAAITGGLIVLIIGGVAGTEYYTSQSDFCGGTCHAMQEQYEGWKGSKHHAKKNPKNNQADCVECHSLPGENKTPKARFIGLRYLSAYLVDPEIAVPKRPVVKDRSCLVSGCHSLDVFQDKPFEFIEKFSFKHRAHLEKPIEGQTLHCDTCHIKNSREKHFEVPREICFLCHFPKANFNEGLGKCALCHVIPTKSLQQQKSKDDPDAKPITHQTLEESKVPCQGCHYQLVTGEGEIKTEDCRDCHRDKKVLAALEKEDRRKVMHESHVADQRALCFDCHQPIQHREQAEFLDPVRTNCALCHPDHHSYQKQLIIGAGHDGVSPTPGLMTGVKTNCTACHILETHKKGEPVRAGTGKACAGCHTKKQEDMLEDWKKTIKKEVAFARELKTEAEEAISAAQGKVPEKVLAEAAAMFEKGLKNLDIVEFGNGVHNKKFSILLLDEAMNNFEDVVDSLGE